MIMAKIMVYNMLFQQPTVYYYSFASPDGKKVDIADFKGKQLLIVNTASECGFTKQYKELQELHEQYGDKLVVIGFPSDNFGNQEYGDNQKIAEFCEKNFGVNFILSEKVDVKGDKQTALFKYLTETDNPDFKGDINWNFEKFLIDKDGKLAHRYRSKVTPLDKVITSQIL